MFLYSFESIQLKESQNEIKMPYVENASEWMLSILLRIGSVLTSTIWRLLLWFTWKMGRTIDTIQIYFCATCTHCVRAPCIQTTKIRRKKNNKSMGLLNTRYLINCIKRPKSHSLLSISFQCLSQSSVIKWVVAIANAAQRALNTDF